MVKHMYGGGGGLDGPPHFETHCVNGARLEATAPRTAEHAAAVKRARERNITPQPISHTFGRNFRIVNSNLLANASVLSEIYIYINSGFGSPLRTARFFMHGRKIYILNTRSLVER